MQVEAKRAVPRSDIPATTAPTKPSSSESRHSTVDLPSNKIFVGGLHYDTRDGNNCICHS